MTVAARLPPVLLVAVVLHTAVLPHLRFFDVAPDLLLLLGVAGGIVGGPDRGAWLGFGTGLLADCFLQTPFGLSALAGAVVGWGVGRVWVGIVHPSWWSPLLTGLVGSAAGVLAFALVGLVVGQDQLVSSRLTTIVGVVAALNAALTPLAVRILRWALDGRSLVSVVPT